MKIGLKHFSQDLLDDLSLEYSSETLLNEMTAESIEDIVVTTEGMKLQDLLRWGPQGVGFGLFLASLKRIEMKLSKIIARCGHDAKYRESVVNHTSQYLPDYEVTMNVLSTLEELYGFIGDVKNGLKTPSAKTVVDILAKAGIKGTTPDISKTKWKLSAVGALSNIVEFILGAGAGGAVGAMFGKPLIGAVVGHFVVDGVTSGASIVGKKYDKDQSRVIKERGWSDSTKVVEACKKTLVSIDNFYKIEILVKDIYINIPKDASLEHRQSVRLLYKVMKGATKAYVRAIKTIGRGLAALPVMSVYDI